MRRVQRHRVILRHACPDGTFVRRYVFSVLLHNISGEDLEIEESRCVAHCLGRKRKMAKADEMTKTLGALNTILAYLKYDDDVQDEKRAKVSGSGLKRVSPREARLSRTV